MSYDALLVDLTAFASVVVIDVVLAGDNALVVGLVASRLPKERQRRVIAVGIAVAMLSRIGFAVVAAELLLVTGLLFAGGLLLLWVAWKLWREIEAARRAAGPQRTDSPANVRPPVKSFGAAVWQIAAADISMSLDNVLGVAGAAHDHVWMLVFGLALSVSLMGVAATVIARFMERHPWLSYLGLAVVSYVAVTMIYKGSGQILPLVTNSGQIN